MTNVGTGREVTKAAQLWLATPYKHQASLKHVGCDCLGLLRGVWRDLYGHEPEMAPPYAPRWNEATKTDLLADMAGKYFTPKPNDAPIKMGDILLFKYRMHLPSRHLAIALSAEVFIHAYVGRGVVENSFSAWWKRHLSGHYAWPSEPKILENAINGTS